MCYIYGASHLRRANYPHHVGPITCRKTESRWWWWRCSINHHGKHHRDRRCAREQPCPTPLGVSHSTVQHACSFQWRGQSCSVLFCKRSVLFDSLFCSVLDFTDVASKVWCSDLCVVCCGCGACGSLLLNQNCFFVCLILPIYQFPCASPLSPVIIKSD